MLILVRSDFVAGEGRIGMAPHKPQRTGSVRDATAEGPKRTPLATMLTDPDGAADSKRPSRQASADRQRASLTRMTNLPAAVQPEDSGYESVELASEQAQSGVSMTGLKTRFCCISRCRKLSDTEVVRKKTT